MDVHNRVSNEDILSCVDASAMRHVGTALSNSGTKAQGLHLGVCNIKTWSRSAYALSLNSPSHHQIRGRKMDTAGRQRHSPLGMLCLPRPGVLPVFAALSFAAVMFC